EPSLCPFGDHTMHLYAALLTVALAPLPTPSAPANAFDHYVNALLIKVPAFEGAKEIPQLTPGLIREHDHVLAPTTGAFVVVKTNQGHMAKLLVRSARQKVEGDKSLPILLIERYVTYKEGDERAVLATGQNVALFPGFRLSLDMGQIVPAELGGDVRFLAD